MDTKHCRDRGGISLSNREEENYEGVTKDNTDLDQANNKYPLQFLVVVGGKLQATKKKRLRMANGKSIVVK